ncbi:MAG: DNA-3-methyladenine glycosylase family protein [Terriglobia bacterium]
MKLHPQEPFNFHRTLRFILSPPALLNGRQFDPLLDYFVEGEFLRVAEIGGETVLYGVSEDHVAGPGAALRVRILHGPADRSTLRAVAGIVQRQLGMGVDLGPFYNLMRRDPVLSRLAVHFHGMRIPQVANPYEALVSAILEQQINLSFAHQVKKALIEKYGQMVEFEGRRYNVFPRPQALAETTPAKLREIQISGPKAKYIIAISEAVATGALDLDALRALLPALAHEKLLALNGVGAWTAHYVGMRALGHIDCLPAADVGLQKAIQFFYGLRKQPACARVESMARKWPGWRSYATFYLWLTYWESAQWKENLRAEIRSLRSGKNA